MCNIIVREADEADGTYATAISEETEASAKARGTGIASRTPQSIREKMKTGNAVIAVTEDGQWVGYAYIEVWSNGEFISNSGLIVAPVFRGQGAATEIKKKILDLSLKKYPAAKIFSITTGLAIMKLNTGMGFHPVTYSEITTDGAFWKKCQSCVNFKILTSKQYENCLCTAFLLRPGSDISKSS